jgi:ABC-type bacteriocin/lantibiotic exporter with double-glycine peptidase domain
MPAGSIPVPHYRQSNPGACLPACVRMVLASFGAKYSEAKLATVLGSYEFGTPSSRVQRLSKLRYHVQYRVFSLEELQASLKQGLYPIVFVDADFLPWADFSGFHALVLVEITSSEVVLFDPAQEEAPSRLLLDGFLAAWEEFNYRAAVISKQ